MAETQQGLDDQPSSSCIRLRNMDILMDVCLPLFARSGRQELGAQHVLLYPVSAERSSDDPDPCPTAALLCLATFRREGTIPIAVPIIGRPMLL